MKERKTFKCDKCKERAKLHPEIKQTWEFEGKKYTLCWNCRIEFKLAIHQTMENYLKKSVHA